MAPQHDAIISNASGAAVRADLNNALAALITNSSGATSPGTTYAFQFWADTTTGQLKIRNAANSAWITLMELDGTMLMEDGSESAPGLAFASDTDTGIFRGASDHIDFATNGTERFEIGTTEAVFNEPSNDFDFRVESNGNTHMLFVDAGNDVVGIGASDPNSFSSSANNLVVQDSAGEGGITIVSTTTGGSNIFFADTAGSAQGQIKYQHDGDYMRFYTNASERVRVDSSGDIDLFIAAANNATRTVSLRSDYGGGTFFDNAALALVQDSAGSSGGHLQFLTMASGGSSPTERVRIDSSGRLLVGASSSADQNAKIQASTTGLEVFEGFNYTNTNAGAILRLAKSRATSIGSQTIVQNNDELGRIAFLGTDGSVYRNAAKIAAEVDSTPGGSDMPGRLVFATTPDGSSTPTERLRIGSAGNCSIGTTTNTNKLRVHNGSDNANIILATGADESSEFICLGIDSGVPCVTAGGVSSTSADLAFRTADNGTESEVARFDSSGRLTVGTSAQAAAPINQHIGLATTTGTAISNLRFTNNTSPPYIQLGKSRGTTVNTYTSVNNGDELGRILFVAADGTDMQNQAASIGCFVDGTPGSNDMPGRIVFSTSSDGSNTPTERIRITNAGLANFSTSISDSDRYNAGTYHCIHNDSTNSIVLALENSSASPYGVLIDFSDAAPNNNGNYYLRCKDSSADNRLYIWSDGDVDNHDNSYSGLSDLKLKQDIVDAGSQWDDIKDLRVRKFKFKSDVAAYGDEAKTLIGVVAQETELVSPGLVKQSPDVDEDGNDLGTTTKSVRYSVLYMKAVKALQEAMDRIETLEAKVAALEAG